MRDEILIRTVAAVLPLVPSSARPQEPFPRLLADLPGAASVPARRLCPGGSAGGGGQGGSEAAHRGQRGPTRRWGGGGSVLGVKYC